MCVPCMTQDRVKSGSGSGSDQIEVSSTIYVMQSPLPAFGGLTTMVL